MKLIPPYEEVPIVLVDKEGNFLKEYPSITKAAKDLKVWPGSIGHVLNGRVALLRKQWFFIRKDAYNPETNYSYKHRMLKKAINKWK